MRWSSRSGYWTRTTRHRSCVVCAKKSPLFVIMYYSLTLCPVNNLDHLSRKMFLDTWELCNASLRRPLSDINGCYWRFVDITWMQYHNRGCLCSFRVFILISTFDCATFLWTYILSCWTICPKEYLIKVILNWIEIIHCIFVTPLSSYLNVIYEMRLSDC